MPWHSVDFCTGPCVWQKNLDAQITKTIGTCLGSITCERALDVLTEQRCVVVAERTDGSFRYSVKFTEVGNCWILCPVLLVQYKKDAEELEQRWVTSLESKSQEEELDAS